LSSWCFELTRFVSQPKEATEVQAVNDFVLFTIAGAGSLLSGEIYAIWGWSVLIYVASGLVSEPMVR
jgi:hypothetical protein